MICMSLSAIAGTIFLNLSVVDIPETGWTLDVRHSAFLFPL